jgi:hypothetical protein
VERPLLALLYKPLPGGTKALPHAREGGATVAS